MISMNSPQLPGSAEQASSYRSSHAESHGHMDARILVPDSDHRARVDEFPDVDLLLSGSAHATSGFVSTPRHCSCFSYLQSPNSPFDTNCVPSDSTLPFRFFNRPSILAWFAWSSSLTPSFRRKADGRRNILSASAIMTSESISPSSTFSSSSRKQRRGDAPLMKTAKRNGRSSGRPYGFAIASRMIISAARAAPPEYPKTPSKGPSVAMIFSS